MKYLLFIVLLVAVVITAGCMSGNQPTRSIQKLMQNSLLSIYDNYWKFGDEDLKGVRFVIEDVQLFNDGCKY